ncbi:MAG TPA: DUF1634 domain-containing protein [Candidatus Limnocylindrales bacterium]|jgi:uncharacterized membrane protein
MTGRVIGGTSAPMAAPPAPTLPRLEARIARLLTIGTLASVALLAIGAVLALANGIPPIQAPPPFDPGAIVADVTSLRPTGFIWLGLLGTLLTPASRVIAALVGFARTGERGMTLVAALILIVIAAGVVAGTVGE